MTESDTRLTSNDTKPIASFQLGDEVVFVRTIAKVLGQGGNV
jgi:hypothetical protein